MLFLRFGIWLFAALVVPLVLASDSSATPIGPAPLSCSNNTCQGSIYELTYSGSPIATNPTPQPPKAPNGTETFQITYTIDTTGYVGSPPNVGTNINAVALKVSASFVDATLVTAPGGVANWAEMTGGLANAGCTGSGSGFDCVAIKALVNAPLVPGATYTWIFDVEVPAGTLATGTNGASVKARYGDNAHLKVGDLVSEGITLEVPEPGMALLLAGPLLLLRRRLRQP